MKSFATIAVLLTLIAGPSSALAESAGFDFKLPDSYGAERSLSDYADAPVVVVAFLGVECPLAKLYGPRLAELAEDYAERGVVVLGVDANTQDSLSEIAAFGRRSGIEFPLLKDDRAEAADLLGATRTPEVVVLDSDRKVCYRGRVDDQYAVGVIRAAPQQRFVRDAIDALLAGEEVSTRETDPVGCVIGRPREADPSSGVTYTNQVARVFQKHCVECHRAGEIAPFALEDYDEAAGWADTIAEVVRDQRMPPWHANPEHGEFTNARVMSQEEKQTLYDWAEAGAPEGDPADLPEPRVFTTDWRLPREPDVVIPMRSEPYRVAAQGVIDYQYFAVDPGFTEDRWVQAADIAPGCRSVVHHVIVYISPPADQQQRGLGWLTAWVPGQSGMELDKNQARLVPAGSKLIFQMHYTPTGAEEEDLTRLALCFADPDEVTDEVVTLAQANPKFEIPPGADDFTVSSTQKWFPAGSKLIGLAPHMHYRGKSFRFTGVWPDGRREVLLDVPAYDFNWQTNYRLAEPIDPPRGFRVELEASFDNSEKNPWNPDPTIPVRWGDQSFEEMMVGFFEVSAPRGSLKREVNRREASEKQKAKARELAQRFFERHDHDGDGQLARGDLPHAFAIFAFQRFDRDNNRRLTEDELYEAELARVTRRF